NRDAAQENREHAFVDSQGGANVKAWGEQQPAQAKRLQWNLAGNALVVLGPVLDVDAAGFHAQQLLDLHLSAAVTHGYDDAADTVLGDNVFQVDFLEARDAPREVGLGTHEANDANAEIRAGAYLFHQG